MIGKDKLLAGVGTLAFGFAAACSGVSGTTTSTAQSASATEGPVDSRCAALIERMQGQWPEADTRLTLAAFQPAGPAPRPPGPPGVTMPAAELLAHCEIIGVMHERTGIDGQKYAVRFHLRMPEQWNGRLFFQGGGGTNGELGDALGSIGSGSPPALARGYAVVSQDSGHDNATNSDPARGGQAAFGFDPMARADYGGASLKPVTLAAKAAIEAFYGRNPEYSYFVGCSKGGQEGMALAQRHPELYDGIIASAPGFSLPRAALAEAWDTQAFASIVSSGGQPVTLPALAATFGEGDLDLLRTAVLDGCDTLDGLKDGIVSAVGQCTSARVLPQLARVTCKDGKNDGCLSQAQVDALVRVHQGPRTSKGEPLYASFPWDGGWADMGWRIWKIGSSDGRIPPLNVALGGSSLATMFTTPPTLLTGGPEANLAYQLGFDFDRDAQKIHATNDAFKRSAWQDIAARSSDLKGFRASGGRMIVPHGVSDPVFSINDTLAWWDEVDQLLSGEADRVVRVFPIPGMAHCGGGPATDQYDAFGALVRWVEQGEAPDRLEATAGPMTPWPGRTRPLCPHPRIARFDQAAGRDPNQSSAFVCTAPGDNGGLPS